VKGGEGLFRSHHLFYNAIGFVWVGFVHQFINIDTLKLLILLNALFAAATLFILGKTLRLLGVEGKRLAIWIAFTGGSWAIMRYATENETYIIPLFFSMLGSYFFIKSLKANNPSNYFYSGLFAAIACLFHQIMFFWWISLLVGVAYRKKPKPLAWFTLPALIVPVSYVLVLVLSAKQPLTLEGLMRFVFRDYYSGAAGVSLGVSSMMFTAIGIVRSFFQVHGYFAILVRFSSLYIMGGVFAIGLLIAGFVGLKQVQWNFTRLKDLPVWVHLIAIILQLLFAFLSSGNVEFMVMIPILLAIVLSQMVQNEVRFFGFIVAGMVVWNLILGLIPLNRYSLDSNSRMSKNVLESQANGTKQLFVLFNKPGVENRVKYYTGDYPLNVVSGIQYDSTAILKQRINIAIENDTIVFTDCIDRPTTLSRETIVIPKSGNDLFGGYNQRKVDSIQTLTGKYYLTAISLKK